MAIHITRDDILIVKGNPIDIGCVPLYIGQICVSINKRKDKLDWFMSYGLTARDWRSVQYYVTETDPYIENIAQALDKLFYPDLNIDFKILSGTLENDSKVYSDDQKELIVEIGSKIKSVDLSWSYLKTKSKNTVLEQFVEDDRENNAITPSPAVFSYKHTLQFPEEDLLEEDKDIKLTIRDTVYEIENSKLSPLDDKLIFEKDENTMLFTKLIDTFVKVKFFNRCCWGTSSTPLKDITEGNINNIIENFDKVLSDDVDRSIRVNAREGEYIYYVVPSRLCEGKKLIFNQGCIDGGFTDPKVIKITNSSDYGENYCVYCSEWPDLGDTKINIRQEEI